MAYIVRMPKLGLEMKTGTLLSWSISEGEQVDQGDVVAEIESEKTQAEIDAREPGVLRRTYLSPGESCSPGDPIGIIAAPDADIGSLETTVANELEETPEPTPPSDHAQAPTPPEEEPPRTPPATSRAIRASPPARRRAEELGVDLATIDGTGPGGAITEDDVTAATTDPTPPGTPFLTLVEEHPLAGTRGTIATRLGESYRNAVHVTERRTVDADDLTAAAAAARTALATDVSVTDLILAATSRTLADHPSFNARFEDDTHRVYEEHNVCIAIDTPDGLIAPVLRDLGTLALGDITAERHRVTERVLAGEHTMDDLTGGTFTITNLGPFGVEAFNPIINPPQIAILGINAITKRAVPDDDTIEIRNRLPLNLSFDHRVVDGADAARFLATLTNHLEEPWPLVPKSARPNEP